MNREIKFRAWDLDSQDRMYSWNEIKLHFSEHVEHERIVVMQYTGLIDKNGVEIYNGDILEVSPGYLFEVLWVNNGWGYKVIKNETERGYIIGHLSQRGLEFYNQSSRVIGNIYSHPHLLEGIES